MATYSSECVNLVRRSEGLRLDAYQDSVGVWTIGYGHTLGVKSIMMIEPERAEAFLLADLNVAALGVKNVVTVPLTQGMFDALTSFVFNLGLGNLKSSTLLKKLNSKDYKGAADEFLKWNHAGKQVLPGLTKRRQAERELFLSQGIPSES